MLVLMVTGTIGSLADKFSHSLRAWLAGNMVLHGAPLVPAWRCNMTLGQTIGRVVDNFAITNDAGDKVQVRLAYDFSTATDVDIKSWLCGNRRIALQRPARAKSKAELEALNGMVIVAVDAGKKVKTRAERIAVYTALGLPIDLAEMAVDDPTKFQDAMAKINVEEETGMSETAQAMAGIDK